MSSRATWCCRAVSRVVLRLGTRGTLGRHPEGFSRFGHSGHVAYSEDIRRDSPGLGTRDTWHFRKAPGEGSPGLGSRDAWRTRTVSGGWHSVWASGTRGTLRRVLKGSLGRGFRDTWHAPKGSEGVSRSGGPGHWIRDRRLGWTCSFGPSDLSGDAGRWIRLGRTRSVEGGVSSAKAGRRQVKGAAAAAHRR